MAQLVDQHVWPRCRSGAVGSKPALTRSGLPRLELLVQFLLRPAARRSRA